MSGMIYVFFFAALVGGYVPLRRTGFRPVQAFGLALLMALLCTGLAKLVFLH